MKKIALAALLGTSLMAADSGMYIGAEYGMVKNTTTMDITPGGTVEGDNDYNDIKIKIGSGTDGGVKFQGSVSFITFDEMVFDGVNDKLIEFGFDVIKEFEVTPSFYPFLKVGMGAGSMDVEGYTDDNIWEVSFNIGAGVSYEVVDHLYLLAGVDYVGRKWQDIEFGSATLSTTDSGIKSYVGMNYRF